MRERVLRKDTSGLRQPTAGTTRPGPAAHQPLSAANTSSSIFFASPNNMRLLSL
jgi:hypothetical protein